MAEYPLDVTVDQIVHWLKDEFRAGSERTVDVRATREYVSEPVANLDEAGLSEDTDVSSMTTVGVLEVTPSGDGARWLLQARVEDVVGPHVPEDESVPDIPEEIDLEAFDREFVAPDRGTAYVTLYAETPKTKKAFDEIFVDIITDRHSNWNR